MVKRDGVILEERYCNEEPNKIKHHCIPVSVRILGHYGFGTLKNS